MKAQIHDCLRLENISRLKSLRASLLLLFFFVENQQLSPIQPIGEAIAGGSIFAVESLSSTITYMKGPDTIHFLPALFVHLAASRIPDPSKLEDILSGTDPTGSSIADNIQLAYHSLNCLSFFSANLSIPLDASPELWPHVWGWLDFLHTFWDYLPMSRGKEEALVCVLHASIIIALARHRGTSTIVRATPGVRRILAMAWKKMLDDDSLFLASLWMASQSLVILADSFSTDHNFREIVDAVGGSVHHLAATLHRHFERANSDARQSTNASHSTAFIGVGFAFSFKSTVNAVRLESALTSLGFVRALVTTASTCEDVNLSNLAFNLLILFFMRPPGHPNLALAIESGLLQAIVKRGAVKGAHVKSKYYFDKLLDDMLPQGTVHYAVVLQLKNALPEAQELAVKLRFHKSGFSRQWKTFTALAQTRIDLLDGDWRNFSASRACDNLDCGKIVGTEEIKCCATCRTRNYCSRICQSVDWRAGHKIVCRELRAEKLHNPDTITTRGRAFLRALLTQDYLHYLFPLSCLQATHMHQNPGRPFFTLFFYPNSTGVQIGCKSSGDLEASGYTSGLVSRLPAAFERMERSGGRMELHIMCIYEGEAVRHLIFPMRISTSQLHDGQMRALELVPEGKGEKEASRIIEESLTSWFRDFRETLGSEAWEGFTLLH
ncbi:hypothetical protein B0H16DRAFT_1475820 [Mycena metata]|uniref:MYND-type domain-containing protein n=1 Tax=Mycena metata TaxID=1033252 RepID=A0AAD7MHN5_9AGAR|nr:hypothetical protein B0H16DRAFT_1475820 [Mycena metata]